MEWEEWWGRTCRATGWPPHILNRATMTQIMACGTGDEKITTSTDDPVGIAKMNDAIAQWQEREKPDNKYREAQKMFWEECKLDL